MNLLNYIDKLVECSMSYLMDFMSTYNFKLHCLNHNKIANMNETNKRNVSQAKEWRE